MDIGALKQKWTPGR